MCSACQLDLTLKVQCSKAGFYIGRFCDTHGPVTRESDYYRTDALARRALRSGVYTRRETP